MDVSGMGGLKNKFLVPFVVCWNLLANESLIFH